ncbi:MAG: hypothetical protein SGILL_003053, partial [Bacillariaceae sp.]
QNITSQTVMAVIMEINGDLIEDPFLAKDNGGEYAVYDVTTDKTMIYGWSSTLPTSPLQNDRRAIDDGRPAQRRNNSFRDGSSGLRGQQRTPELGRELQLESKDEKMADRALESTAGPSTFHPEFLSSISDFSVIRFMDWAHTNSQQVAIWSERTTPTSVSQVNSYIRMLDIVSIEAASPTGFSGPNVIKVSTATPHGLTTGQRINIENSNGEAQLSNGESVSFDVTDRMVEVHSASTFIVTLENWAWDYSATIASTLPGNIGTVTIRFSPGVSLEHMIELANEARKDAWFSVPHLADDDFVRNMAALIHDTLDPSLKAYIEYSNEIWNWSPSFWQTRYASKMAAAVGMTEGNRHLLWYGQRARDIFGIFDDVFGVSARDRLVRVIGVQAGSGNDQLSQVGIGGADALAIAPYFGGGLNYDLYDTEYQSMRIDEILDLARASVVADTLSRVTASYRIAEDYKVKLIAYEGGQHLGGGGSCGSEDCANLANLQAMFQEANHHPRMMGLYTNMLKAWMIGSESNAGVFAAFSHIGFDSKWGSWGVLQHQLDDKSTAWKYRALVENV